MILPPLRLPALSPVRLHAVFVILLAALPFGLRRLDGIEVRLDAGGQ